MKYYTFEELKEIAFNNGIIGNKVTIGIWARMNGYLKKKKQINKLRITLYFNMNEYNTTKQ